MADFNRAHKGILKIEGGYSNNPADAGGETVFGISRRYWPGLPLWKKVDHAKTQGDDPGSLKIAIDVEDFYKQQFWDRFLGDRISSEPIAAELFDQAINLGNGVHRAVSHLQRALNVCNRQQRLWADVALDGVMGSATLAAIRACREAKRDGKVVRLMNAQQAVYYMGRMEDRAANEEFIGWYDRT